MPKGVDGRLRVDRLAAIYGAERRDIEHLETIGLLAPLRDESGSYYSAADEIRLQVILKARKLGFSDKEIAAMLERFG